MQYPGSPQTAPMSKPSGCYRVCSRHRISFGLSNMGKMWETPLQGNRKRRTHDMWSDSAYSRTPAGRQYCLHWDKSSCGRSHRANGTQKSQTVLKGIIKKYASYCIIACVLTWGIRSFVIFMSTRFSFSHTFPLFAHDILSFTRFTHLAHFFAEFELIFSG